MVPSSTPRHLGQLATAALAVAWLLGFRAATAAEDAPVDFVRDVRPIFVRACLRCHGPERHKGGRRLDVRALALKGSDSGEPEARAVGPVVASDTRLEAEVRRYRYDELDDVVTTTGADLFGLDQKRLTYLHNGRRFRLTDVSGSVLTDIVG